jgi:hypothetical protein
MQNCDLQKPSLLHTTILALASILVLVQKFIRVSPSDFPTAITKRLPVPFRFSCITNWLHRPSLSNTKEEKINQIKALAEHHDVAEKLNDLIQKDGTGSWPPNANHDHTTWLRLFDRTRRYT